ncbi:MAG TPA: hypothetical protein DHW64_06705 [Chitinophagaceae bacterium]|nr:hypothetical protein [Chitinophagaceae bacterium]
MQTGQWLDNWAIHPFENMRIDFRVSDRICLFKISITYPEIHTPLFIICIFGGKLGFFQFEMWKPLEQIPSIPTSGIRHRRFFPFCPVLTHSEINVDSENKYMCIWLFTDVG